MAGKSGNTISVNGDEALDTLRKVNAAHESPGLPSLSSVVVQGPPDVGAVVSFNSGMNSYANGMKSRIALLRNNLQHLHEDIKQTVAQFAARDAAVSDEAAALVSSLESLPAPTVATTQPGTSQAKAAQG